MVMCVCFAIFTLRGVWCGLIPIPLIPLLFCFRFIGTVAWLHLLMSAVNCVFVIYYL